MSRRDLERRYDKATGLPPGDLPSGRCWCGAYYLDTDGGRDAHEIVMGHRPESADPTRSSRQSPDRSLQDHQADDPRRVDDVSPEMPGPLDAGHGGEVPTGARDPTTEHGQNDRDQNEE